MIVAQSPLAPNLTRDVLAGLGWGWMILASVNVLWSIRSFRRSEQFPYRGIHIPVAAIWALHASLVASVSFACFAALGPPNDFFFQLPTGWGEVIDGMFASREILFLLIVAKFVLLVGLFRLWTKPNVAWVILNLGAIEFLFFCTDIDFRNRVLSFEAAPVTLTSLGLAFVLWAYFRRVAMPADAPAQEPLAREFWPDKCVIGFTCAMGLLLVLTVMAMAAPPEVSRATEPGSVMVRPPWFLAGFEERAKWGGSGGFSGLIAVLIFGTLVALPWLDGSAKPNEVRFHTRRGWVLAFLFVAIVIGLGCANLGAIFPDEIKLFSR